jgi:HEAT repeat protein
MPMASIEKKPSVPREGTRLRSMRSDGDVPGLVRELENPHEEHGEVCGIEVTHTVRGRAAHELSRLSAAEAVQPIIRLLNDPEATVRCDAAIALGRLGDLRAGEPLIAALDDSEETVLSCAVRSLGQLTFKPAVEPLIPLLGHPNVRIRIMTATALSRIGDKTAIGPLRNAMRNVGWRHPVTRLRITGSTLALGIKRSA